MGDESGELHSEDDNVIVEKNRKRTVKTSAQIQALEKFFNEHRYPTESMKAQLAEAVGLTEKQISGWFCHRRLKDKKSVNRDSNLTRSSGVAADPGKQDSCGSTKQGDERNFDTREVESGRVISKEFSGLELRHEHGGQFTRNRSFVGDSASGSSSDVPNHQVRSSFGDETSMYLIQKLPDHEKQAKARSGPSGYLKVKNRVENPAITAVKKQLGMHYKHDGPPLSVEFDPLPPGAFEYSPVGDGYCANEPVPPVVSEVSKFSQKPKFDERRVYEPRIHVIRPGFRSPNGYMNHEFGPTYLSISGNSSAEAMRMESLPPPGRKIRERSGESRFYKLDSAISTGFGRDHTRNNYTDSCTTRESLKPGKLPFMDEQYQKFDNSIQSYQAIRSENMTPSSCSDEERSEETSSSVD